LLGRPKLDRLRTLAGRSERLQVVADSLTVAEGLSEAFAGAPSPLRVLVECDTGGRRCGVGDPAGVSTLAGQIDRLPGLRFTGLMTYPPPGQRAAVGAFLAEARQLCDRAGLE